jgi:Fe-S-cluster containining protein
MDRIHGDCRTGDQEESSLSGQSHQSPPESPKLRAPSVSPCLRVASDSLPSTPLAPHEAVELLARRQGELIGRELVVLQEAGGAVSCQAGCAACCRQLVVVSPLEALAIERHVRSADRAQRRRWEAAHARHSRALSRQPALMRRLQAFRAARGYLSPGEGDRLEREYWAAQLPCPFLEKERCTIYPVRPFACREHFAVTPPEQCARDPDSVRMPPTRFEFRAVAGQVGEQCLGLVDRLVPLFEAVAYAAEHQSEAKLTAPLGLITRAMESALARVLAWRARLTAETQRTQSRNGEG